MYVFIAPMLLLFVLFTLYPVFGSFRYTLYDWNGIGEPRRYVGITNFFDTFRDPWFWNAFKNTLIYTLVLVPIQLAIALVMAVILDRPWLRARYVYRAAFIAPIVTSSAIVGIIITLLVTTANRGVNQLVLNFGLLTRPFDWLGDARTAMPILIGTGIWIGLGYPIIYFLAALQSIDKQLYDAAKVDGAGIWASFRHVTVPQILPVGVVVALLVALSSLRVFDIVQVMTKGGPYFATDVVSTYVYRYTFATDLADPNVGRASAAAFLVSLLIGAVTVLEVGMIRRIRAQK
ncbi:MAG: sugar ABC transporter permease [Anaerolineae bacterium]